MMSRPSSAGRSTASSSASERDEPQGGHSGAARRAGPACDTGRPNSAACPAIRAALGRRPRLRRPGRSGASTGPGSSWQKPTACGTFVSRSSSTFGIVSKSLVAAQVMQLAEAGKLALDDPAADHLPADLDFDTKGATIRQLLSHRSGIPDYWSPDFERSPTMDARRVWTTEELLESMTDARGPVDVAYSYSNTNYVLLGLVSETAGDRWWRCSVTASSTSRGPSASSPNPRRGRPRR